MRPRKRKNHVLLLWLVVVIALLNNSDDKNDSVERDRDEPALIEAMATNAEWGEMIPNCRR